MRYSWLVPALGLFLAATLGLQANLVVYKGKVKIKYEGGGDKGTIVRDAVIIRDLDGDVDDIDDDSFEVVAIDKANKTYSVNNEIDKDGAAQNDDGKKEFEMVQLDIDIVVGETEGGDLIVETDADAYTSGNKGKVKLSKEVAVEVAKTLKLKGHAELNDTALEGPTPTDHEVIGTADVKINLRVHGGLTKEANDPEGIDGNLEDARDALIDELEDNGYSNADS